MKILCISLLRSPHRRASMAPFREIPDINFSFLDATDAKTGELIPFKEKFYSRRLAKLCKGRPLTDGEIACFASHFRAWQKCVELNEAVIVCEDDIELSVSSNDLRAKLEKIQSSPYEYVRFMKLKKTKTTRNLLPGFAILFSGASGTQAYYLTPHAAKKFILKAQKWIMPVDDYMDLYWIHGIPIVITCPHLVKESNTSSDIGHPPSHKKRQFSPTKITSECFRIYQSIRKFLWVVSHPSFFKATYKNS